MAKKKSTSDNQTTPTSQRNDPPGHSFALLERVSRMVEVANHLAQASAYMRTVAVNDASRPSTMHEKTKSFRKAADSLYNEAHALLVSGGDTGPTTGPVPAE